MKRAKKNAKIMINRAKSFGPVASITTAPVAIGNSIRGASSISTRTKGGVVVSGRDFMFTPIGTGSITTWIMVGGTPLSPAAFADDTIRQYLQMYQKYRWRACRAHYITSSPTSASGDVMFYHGKNRDSVFLNQTSSFLLPFVISDPDTVLGPQWTNHTADLRVEGVWKSTDYGMADSPNDYSDGEVFLLSKTSTTDSPGYVLFDYVIEFAEMQISPRLLTLPIPRIQYWETNVGATAATVVTGATRLLASLTGNNVSGTSATFPPGYTSGDIYKVIVDVTNSSAAAWTVATPSTLLQGSSNNPFFGAIPLQDGTTIYAIAVNSTTLVFVRNVVDAYAQADILDYASTGTVTWNLQISMSFIGSLGSINLNPNF